MRLAPKVVEAQPTTIFALSSGRPPAGIAIVRLSGPHAFVVLNDLIGSLPPLRQLVRRRLVDGDGGEIDTAMVVRFAAPASATGEDLVEFHLHGGVAVVARMLDVLGAIPGIELAERGAFARRAFDNGRLDLAQVEGLADLIEAETESQRRLAVRQAAGELHQHVDKWREIIIEACANVEAVLDFADESDVAHRYNDITDLAELREQLAVAIDHIRRAHLVRDGAVVAIVGPVNAGKSSLVNLLAGRDVAIVSDTPGTTRDIIEVRLNLDGMVVTLLDTAGIQSSINEVETEGIRRGQERASRADLVIAVGDPTLQAGLHLVSKSDQLATNAGWHGATLHVSSATGDGIDLLIEWLINWARNLVRPNEPILLTQRHHAEAVRAAIAAIDLALSENDMLLVSEHLKQAAAALDRLIGRVAPDDLLGSIFSRFCIGK